MFLFLNLRGVELSFKVSVIVTLGALAVLAIYWVSAIPHFDFEALGAQHRRRRRTAAQSNWLKAAAAGCRSVWPGALAALPFAVWLFLAIEQLPLAAEESDDPKHDMPKGLIYGMATLMVSALLITFLNSGVGSTDPDKMHGAFSLATSGEPLLDGFRVIYGTGTAKLLAFLAVIGLIASFHTIIYAYGRQIYSLSRAGYYLPFMSLTHGTHKVPHMALYTGTVMGFVIMLVVWFVRRRGKARRGDRRHAAQHGGVRRDDLLRDAGTLVHPAAPEHAEHRAPVPEPARRAGRVRDGRDRAGDASITSCRIRCTASASTRRRSGMCWASCTSRSSAGTSWCCRRKRNSR